MIARLARSNPRNHFVVVNFLCAVCSNFRVFRHVVIWIVSIGIILNLNKFRHVWTCSDMFENRICSNFRVFCHVVIWIVSIRIILNLDKFRHVWTSSDMFSKFFEWQELIRLHHFGHISIPELWEFNECFEHLENWLVALGASYRAILDSILLSLVFH